MSWWGGINLYAYAPNPLKWRDPLWQCKVDCGADVTSDIIRDSLKDETIQTLQGSISLPAIQGYVARLLKGDIAPLLKVGGDVIVDGYHRYVAGKILGEIPEAMPGLIQLSAAPDLKLKSDIGIVDID